MFCSLLGWHFRAETSRVKRSRSHFASAQMRLFFPALLIPAPIFFQQWHREYCPCSISLNCRFWAESCSSSEAPLWHTRWNYSPVDVFLEYWWVLKHLSMSNLSCHFWVSSKIFKALWCFSDLNFSILNIFSCLQGSLHGIVVKNPFMTKAVWLIGQMRLQTLGHSAVHSV